MLVWCIGECMVLKININNDIKEPPRAYQNCRTSQILMFGGYNKVTESFVYLSYYLGQHHSNPYSY